MSTVTSKDGTTIAYDRAGDGPALIMVDAALGFRDFGPMPALAERLVSDFTVIVYDRRGRGESTDTLPYAVDREIEDLRALIDAAGGSAYVYGFSSGAVLALLAAARGAPISKLALLEPPIIFDDDPPAESELAEEIAELVAAGRRGDAVEHFQRSIGVPAEVTDGMRDSPAWQIMEQHAHTLVYDCVITKPLPVSAVSSETIPTLVASSAESSPNLVAWATDVAEALPAGIHRSLPGDWHGVDDDVLAPALVDFFGDDSKGA